MSKVYSQHPIPDDIYYVIMQFDYSKIKFEKSKFPFYDMLIALLDIKTVKEPIERTMHAFIEKRNQELVKSNTSPKSPQKATEKLKEDTLEFTFPNVNPENVISIRISSPFLTFYEAKTRELTMKYTLNNLSHTSSWKVENDESVCIVSEQINFSFQDKLLSRLTGTHEKIVEIGFMLLKTAHAYFQEQRMRNFYLKYDESTMPELKLDIEVIDLTFEERSIQQTYKSENLVLKPHSE